MLLPVLSSLADRVRALREAGPIPPDLERLLADTAAWIGAGPSNDPEALAHLRARTAAADRPLGARSDWTAIIRVSLLERIGDLLDVAEDSRALRSHIDRGDRYPTALAFHRAAGLAEVHHRDHGRALWSAASAAFAVVLCCAFWIAAGWPDGAVAAEMVAVACSFFAAMDDPVPAIMQFLTWSGVAVLVDGIYLFGILPPAQDFTMLALALAPTFLVYGAITAMPQTSAIGMALASNGATLLSLQSTYNATFEPFANSGLALLVGMGLAAIVTAVVRSVGAEWSARQLLRRGWIDLAVAAERRGSGDRAVFAALMLDRIGLLAPRIAAVSPGSDLRALDLLAELRIGLNIVGIRRARRALPDDVRARIDAMLDALAAYFRNRVNHDAGAPPAGLLASVDDAMAAVTQVGEERRARDAVLGLVGIRRGLFPDAPPYDRVPPEPDVSLSAAA